MGGFIDYLEANAHTSESKGGQQLIIHDDCPFNGCTGGRIYVDVEKEVGVCFRCGQGFSGVGYVAALEGISRGKALRIMGGSGDRYTHLPEEEEEGAVGIHWWPVCIMMTEEALEYMRDRGFDAEFCQQQRLAYCPTNTNWKGTTHPTGGRIVIPIYSRSGDCIGWQARDITGKAWMKYYIQPDFDAAECLYNVHWVEEGKPLIVVEGIMDAWGWIRAGFTNVVATWGKKISAAQLITLAALRPSTVYVAWDGDAKAEVYRFAEDYAHIFDVRIVDMGKDDADELGRDALAHLYETAASYRWEKKIMDLLAKM